MLPMLFLLALGACLAPQQGAADSVDSAWTESETSHQIDARADAPPAPEGGLQIVSPELIIAPNSDEMSCFVGTYTGPEIGISLYQWFQDDDFGHHVVFADGSSLGPEVLDGSLIDCSNPFESMKLPPLLQPTESIGPHAAELQLAEGQAVRLKSGQRWVMQSHYVNASDNELLAQDVINFGFTPVEDVNFWVSSWTFNNSVFSVAPGATLDLEFSCEWPESANVMTMMGHMHDFGTSMWVSHETGGSSVQIYRLPDWSPQWQADPVFIDFELGELTPIAGDTFTVGCSFHNTSDEQLEFPREMCVATGVAGPLDAPIECDAGYPD